MIFIFWLAQVFFLQLLPISPIFFLARKNCSIHCIFVYHSFITYNFQTCDRVQKLQDHKEDHVADFFVEFEHNLINYMPRDDTNFEIKFLVEFAVDDNERNYLINDNPKKDENT